MSPTPQTEYGVNRKEATPNSEKKKVSKWPWIVGGTALAGIIGGGYWAYNKIDQIE